MNRKIQCAALALLLLVPAARTQSAYRIEVASSREALLAGRADVWASGRVGGPPGYGFQLKKGATALTESWAALEEVSNNHLIDLLDWARGEYRSPRGRIASSWKKAAGRLVLEVEVPVNATAVLHVPATAGALVLESGRPLDGRQDVALESRTAREAVVALGSGRYRFEVTR